MNILLTGGSGLIGSTLVEYFVNKGSSVFCLQRNKGPHLDSFWNFSHIDKQVQRKPFDAVIHLAGENIATGRWTKKKKTSIIESRVKGTSELASYCASLPVKPKLFFSASAIGYYGNRGDEQLDEQSPPGKNFVSHVCQQWEKAAQPVYDKGIRVVHGRIGMVLSGKGGTLLTMLPSFKAGIAGIVGNGKQYISWVDIRDITKIIDFLIMEDSISGPVNLVSPTAVTNRSFTKTLGSVLGKPTVMKMPAFVARIVFGQMGEELVLSSTRVKPTLLHQKNYEFVVPRLEKSLRINCQEALSR